MAAPSFPDIHVTGAVQHFIRVVTHADPLIYFLGTCEITPQVSIREYTNPVMNDNNGKTLPMDETDDGEDAALSLMLNYYSKYAYGLILEAGLNQGRVVSAGTNSRWRYGGLTYGIRTFELWQVFDNFFNPNGASEGLEIGWYWPQVKIVSHDTPARGTQAEKLLLNLEAKPKRIPQASASAIVGNERGNVLYSNSASDFPTEVRIPQ